MTPAPPDQRPRSWLRPSTWSLRRRALAAPLIGLAIVFAASTYRLFVAPPTDVVDQVDAVVMFVGGRGERLTTAEALMDDGAATILVIPNGEISGWEAGNRACREERSYQVLCPFPDPDTTRGEARLIAELARREGWNELAVVTSTYHLARATLLLSRCFDGTIVAVDAPTDLGPWSWAIRVGHEWIGWSAANTLQRSC
ncbi:MAG: YdcF family protein [Acidimicrobiales bacterium]